MGARTRRRSGERLQSRMIAQGLVDRLRPRGTARSSDRYELPGRRRRAQGRRLGRRGQARAGLGLALVAVLVGGWLLFRDSPLVSASHVTVEGESGPDAARIRQALQSAAHTMSTLDVDMGRLRSAVAPYPIVKDLEVTTQFPHGMRIHVRRAARRSARSTSAGARCRSRPTERCCTTSSPPARCRLIPLRRAARRRPGDRRQRARRRSGCWRRRRTDCGRRSARSARSTGHGLVAQLRDGPAHLLRRRQRSQREVAGGVRGARRSRLRRRRLHRRHRPGAARRGRGHRQHDRPDDDRAGCNDDPGSTAAVSTTTPDSTVAPTDTSSSSTTPPEANPQVEL